MRHVSRQTCHTDARYHVGNVAYHPLTITHRLQDITLARRATADGLGRTLRLSARITQREAARELRVSQAALCRYEAGTRVPREEIAVRYGALLRGWMADGR